MVAGRDGGARDWHTAEPGLWRELRRELERLYRRTRARPGRALLLAAALTSLAMVRVTTAPELHTARIVLRATEGALSQQDGSVLSSTGLIDRIHDTAFTRHNLLTRVVEQHGVHRGLLERRGPDAAIEAVMEPLTIEVVRNYFLHTLREESSQRSLRVAISYQDADPDQAYRMASLLAELVITNVHSQRLVEARALATSARAGLARLERKIAADQEHLHRLMFALAAAEVSGDARATAQLRVDVKDHDEALRAEHDLLAELRAAQRERELQLRVEERRMALTWDVAGEARPRPARPPGPAHAAALALLCFGALVPLCAIVLGAFDSKVHDAEDVRRLGLPVVGHVPGFPGDDRGALATRLTRSRRGRGPGRRHRHRDQEGA